MILTGLSLLSSALGSPVESPKILRWEETLVASALHPVRVHPMSDWHRAMALAMEGPHASTLFRSTASRMNCHWQLSANGSAPFLSESYEEVILDQALLGATLGWEATLRGTLDRSEEMTIIRRVLRTASGPALAWTGGEDGGTVRVDDPGRRSRMAMVDLEAGPQNRPPIQREPPPPTIRLGSGLRMVAQDHDELWLESGEVSTDPALSMYVQGLHLGIDQFRLELLWESPGMRDQELAWELGVREGLHSSVAWVNSIQGNLHGELERARSSLEWHPPQVQPWILRTGVLIQPDSDSPYRAEVALQVRSRWRLPQAPDQWPLGLEPGADGPYWPSLPDRSPNQLVELSRNNAERVAGWP